MKLQSVKQLSLIRLLICAPRILYNYFVVRGHIRRRYGMSVGRDGRFRPWLVYPAIDYLSRLDLSGYDVFEFGAGTSTMWWAERVHSVTSVDHDREWFEMISRLVPENVEIVRETDLESYPEVIQSSGRFFDIVVVDGAERFRSAQTSMTRLKEEGIILLDNTDWYPNTAAMLRDNGFTQVDFSGFPPNNSYPAITSIFFKSPAMLQRRLPGIDALEGGFVLPLGAHDDGQ